MADVCELAHERTADECAEKGIVMDSVEDNGELSYTAKAQRIFDRHYDEITERTGL